jgi:ADP-ribose pyrophosphatase
MERIDSTTVYEGKIATVRVDRFRHEDGSEVEREAVAHPGAVAVIAHDEIHIHLVRQPREAVDEESVLELPAGKLDVPGESPLECAKRELAEEVGLAAEEWTELKRFYTSPGFADEEVIVYLATDLRRVDYEPDPEERIEIAPWPLDDIEGAVEASTDAKTLIGLLLFRQLRA